MGISRTITAIRAMATVAGTVTASTAVIDMGVTNKVVTAGTTATPMAGKGEAPLTHSSR